MTLPSSSTKSSSSTAENDSNQSLATSSSPPQSSTSATSEKISESIQKDTAGSERNDYDDDNDDNDDDDDDDDGFSSRYDECEDDGEKGMISFPKRRHTGNSSTYSSTPRTSAGQSIGVDDSVTYEELLAFRNRSNRMSSSPGASTVRESIKGGETTRERRGVEAMRARSSFHDRFYEGIRRIFNDGEEGSLDELSTPSPSRRVSRAEFLREAAGTSDLYMSNWEIVKLTAIALGYISLTVAVLALMAHIVTYYPPTCMFWQIASKPPPSTKEQFKQIVYKFVK